MSEKSALPMVAETTSAACCGDDCCGGTKSTTTSAAKPAVTTPVMPVTPTMPTDPRAVVREKYGAIAQGDGCCGGSGCGCGGTVEDDAAALAALGYSDAQRDAIPAGADLGLGCGNPLAHAELRAGEVVLDLGSGGGIDCFLAAREVGATGRVIGVDMTPAMIERARGNLAKVAATNVEFRLGEIEHLPVVDASVDVVISNCVVNLSPDKPRVFREALRVLKPGGRLVVSDLVLTRPLEPELQRNVDLYVGCVAGASQKEEYLQLMRDAGFAEVTIVEERQYAAGMENLPADGPERDAFAAVVSVKVRAIKR